MSNPIENPEDAEKSEDEEDGEMKVWEKMKQDKEKRENKYYNDLIQATENSLNSNNDVINEINKQKNNLKTTSEQLSRHLTGRKNKGTEEYFEETAQIKNAQKLIKEAKNPNLTLKEIKNLIYRMEINLFYKGYDYDYLLFRGSKICGINENEDIDITGTKIYKVIALRKENEKKYKRVERENNKKIEIEEMYNNLYVGGEVKTNYQLRF